MLKEIELGIVEKIKNSALKTKLKQIECLPEISGEKLVNKFVTDAPGVYVATSDFEVIEDQLPLKFVVAAVVRNSASKISPRHGDGKTLGLYELVEVLLPVLHGLKVNGQAVLYVQRVQWVKSDLLFNNGLEVAELTLSGQAGMPPLLDVNDLDDFETFAGQYDIPPHVNAIEHNKWNQDAPDYSTSKPDLKDTIEIPT